MGDFNSRGEVAEDANAKSSQVAGVSKAVTGIPSSLLNKQLHIEKGKTEKALQELNRLKFAMDQHSIIAVTDPRGRITYVNDKFCEISQYSQEELIGQDHRIINSGYHPKTFFTNLWSTITKGDVWKGEICNRAKDNSLYWVDTTIVPSKGSDNVITQYVVIRTDISAVKEAEAKQAERADFLEQINRELDEFAYLASHDLQEPLRNIVSFVQLLKRDLEKQEPDKIERDLDFIERSASRLQEMVDALLDLSRSANAELVVRAVEPMACISQVISQLHKQVDQAKAEFTQDKMPEVIFGDQKLLTLLFQNLISNALKYRLPDESVKIHFTCEKKEGKWILGVRDNGIGIEKAYLDRIFAPFKRVHNNHEYEGTGIGLTLCRKIVKRHQGVIWVESTPGEGAHFRFSIPLAFIGT